MFIKQSFYGQFIHLFNRGNNKDALFREECNYYQFLELYKKYMKPVVSIYAYCLLPTHLHLLIKVKEVDEIGRLLPDEQMFWHQYRVFLGMYTRHINETYHRSGKLFNGSISRKLEQEENSFFPLIAFIHQNPQVYGIVSDYRMWPFSSYFAYRRKDRRSILAKEFFFDDDSYRSIMDDEENVYYSNPID